MTRRSLTSPMTSRENDKQRNSDLVIVTGQGGTSPEARAGGGVPEEPRVG